MVIIQVFWTDLHQKYKIWTDLLNFWKGGANVLILGGLNIWALIFQLCHCPTIFLVSSFFFKLESWLFEVFEESWSDYSGVWENCLTFAPPFQKSRSSRPRDFNFLLQVVWRKQSKSIKVCVCVCVCGVGGGGWGVGWVWVSFHPFQIGFISIQTCSLSIKPEKGSNKKLITSSTKNR